MPLSLWVETQREDVAMPCIKCTLCEHYPDDVSTLRVSSVAMALKRHNLVDQLRNTADERISQILVFASLVGHDICPSSSLGGWMILGQ